MMRRALGLDVGERRIGVAVSDLLGLTAQGLATIETRGRENDLSRLREFAHQYDVRAFVVGLPKNMDGSLGFQARRVQEFAEKLVEMEYDVFWQDERLTTALARRTLIEADVGRKKRKQVIDKLAAVHILQSFLDGGGAEKLRREDNA